jgi:uncharacterized protein YegL
VSSENLQSFMVPGGNYGYTGTPVNNLTSFEYTLAQGLLDESGSTNSFARAMELAVKEMIKALRRSPRADNLMYRQSHFATNYREQHGWMPLAKINLDDYDGCYQPGGMTTLYDSNERALKELQDYAHQQAAMKYLCNGFFFCMTDGRDYGSTFKPQQVRDAFTTVVKDESMESLLSILIGVNDDPGIQKDLEAYANLVGYTQYLPLKDADEKTLAKLAAFISQSIQAQSQALGTGGPSKSLTF